ncbi:DNA polymerase III subunit delta [Chloroflexota bacterium]
MLYILFGANDFSLREELRKITDDLGERDLLACNTAVFDGRHLKLNQLTNVCTAMPFLGSNRLVIVEGLLGRVEESAGDWLALKDLVGVMPETTVLVLIDGQIKRGNPLLRELGSIASVRQFPLLKGAALRGWIKGRVAHEGGAVSAQAVGMLAALVGDNLWVLASEIEKLLNYAWGQRIEEEDVKMVVSSAREVSVFTMVDALIEGRASTAARLLHQLLEEGATVPYLLVMITRQLRLLLQVKELILKRMPASIMRERLGIASDYVLTKALEQGKRYSVRRLEQVYRKLLETDLAIKRGVWTGEIALDLLVAELSA